MRKYNIITIENRISALDDAHYVDTLPLYQKGDSFTLDASEADKAIYGQPIQVESKPEYSKPSKIYDPEPIITFSPSNPSSRYLALEARAKINNAVSPNIYMDKLEATKYCNDSVTALSTKIKSLKSE